MTARNTSDPKFVRIDGSNFWQFPNGHTVPVVHGAADDKDKTESEIPGDLTEIDDEPLGEMQAKLTAEFDKLVDEGSRDVATLTALADDIDRIKGEFIARETAGAEADAAVAALQDRVKGPEAEAEAEAEPEAEPEADAEPEAEPVAEEEEEAEEEVKPEKKELVTASARPRLSDVARRTLRPRVTEKKPQVAITAAADLPGLSPGSTIDLLQVAESMHDRARNLSDGQRAPVARIDVPQTHVLGTDPMENVGIIDSVIGQPEAAALVASGGWCAPSEPIFDLFDIGPDMDNTFDLPGLGTKVRAGVMIPSFYGIADAEDALWTWTEQDDIDAESGTPTKPCLKIPCPTFTECRLEAEGLCVTHGNLSDRAWPELTKQFLSIVMGAHQRRMSSAKIAKVLADTTTVTPGAGMAVSDAAGDLLNVISLAAADMRSEYRVGKRRSVDVLLPDWTLEVLRSNMAMRQGIWDAMNVSDSTIQGWLNARGVRVQFTPDWQPLHDTAAATEWPTEVTFAIWFSGSYIALDGGSIDLGVVRDSTLNATNDFTAAWSEQFYQVCRRGPQGRQYTVPLNINGVTGCCVDTPELP